MSFQRGNWLNRCWVLAVAGFLLLSALSICGRPAAAAATATVEGQVVDQQNALPIADAVVSLLRSSVETSSTKTDAFGRFKITGVEGGVYDVVVSASGYTTSTNQHVFVAQGANVSLNAALVAAKSAVSTVRTLGTVTVSASSLASATAITQAVPTVNIVQTGQQRFVNQLNYLPAVNMVTSSSPGDDVTIDIRGFGSTETGNLLDGRPVGPFGVLAPDNFNYANSPVGSLNGVDVTYGSGSQGLYGSDTIAGAVNMHLINPSATTQAAYLQQVGGYGLLTSAFDVTGTTGRFGYVAEAGYAGQTGQFDNVQLFQSARPANLAPGAVNPPVVCGNSSGIDVSACNQGAETYNVSQANKIGTELAKLRYQITQGTAVTFSGYSTAQWADSTGNGDNDFLPYSSRLAQIQASSPTCATGSGPGYLVTTNPISFPSGNACLTAQQWAALSSGPDGGGANRNRSTTMQDYDGRVTSTIGKNNITLDTYVNNYIYQKNSCQAGGLNAVGSCLGTPVFADYYFTHGYLVSDDITSTKNDFAFGYALLNQEQSGNQLVGFGTADPVTGESFYAFQPNFNTAIFRETSWFLRDNWEANPQLSAFVNAWVKHSNVTDKTTFDPRASVQYRPDTNDVIRLTYGRSDGPPAPILKSTAPVFQPNPGSSLTNVTCTFGSNTLSNSAGNPNLFSESANDYELGYGRRFEADSNVQINAYVTDVSNQLYAANQPLTDYGVGNVLFAAGTLETYLARLEAQSCLPHGSPVTAVYPFLAVPTTYNLANLLARGVDLNGRQRFTSNFYIDYGYSVESSQQFNVPDSILSNGSNYTINNGGQQNQIPLHQANISLDFQPGQFEVRLDNYWIDSYNTYDRPGFIVSNFFITHPFEKGKVLVTLGGTNIFNQAVQNYGYIGLGLPQRANPFAPNAPYTGIAQNIAGIATNEEFGIQPANLTLSLVIRS
jgi:hypothetical protein